MASSVDFAAIVKEALDVLGDLFAHEPTLQHCADQPYLIAHDYTMSNPVCASGSHYPIEWYPFRKEDTCEDGQFTGYTKLCLELINDAICRDIPGDSPFDGPLKIAIGHHAKR